jgi:hypothetical protein
MKRYALGFYLHVPGGARCYAMSPPLPAEFESVWLHVPSALGYYFVMHGVRVDGQATDTWSGPVLASCMGDGQARFDLSFRAPTGSVVELDVENVDFGPHQFRATLMGEVQL